MRTVVKKNDFSEDKICDQTLVVKFHELIRDKDSGWPRIKDGEYKGNSYRKIFGRVQVVEGEYIAEFVPMSLSWKGLEFDLDGRPELHIAEDAGWHPAWVKAARAMGVNVITDDDFDSCTDELQFLLMLEDKLKKAGRFVQVKTNDANDKGEGGGWVISDTIQGLASGYEKHVREEYEKAKAAGVFSKKKKGDDDDSSTMNGDDPYSDWGVFITELLRFLDDSGCSVKIGESGEPISPTKIIKKLRDINGHDKFTDVPLMSFPLWIDLIKSGIVGEFDDATMKTILAKMPGGGEEEPSVDDDEML